MSRTKAVWVGRPSSNRLARLVVVAGMSLMSRTALTVGLPRMTTPQVPWLGRRSERSVSDEERDVSEMMTPEAAFSLLADGMLAFRADLKLDAQVTKDELAAVWAWARRAYKEGGLEGDLLSNVLDGQMWADWQGGSIVFRLTPAGLAHVEGLIAKSPSGSIAGLMGEMGFDVDALDAAKGKRAES